MVKLKFKNVAKRALAILCAFVMSFNTAIAAKASENNISELSSKELYEIDPVEIEKDNSDATNTIELSEHPKYFAPSPQSSPSSYTKEKYCKQS